MPTKMNSAAELPGIETSATEEQCLAQSRDLNGLGCDGQDNDCDDEVDECDEDSVPPQIIFRHGLAVDASVNEDGLTVIDSPTLSSLSDTQTYLENIVEAEDDCVAGLQPEVICPGIGALCQSTIFTVRAADNSCVNQTVVRQFIMKVDKIGLDVTISFDNGGAYNFSEVGDGVYRDIVSDDKGLCFLSMCLFIAYFKRQSASDANYENTFFSYSIRVS